MVIINFCVFGTFSWKFDLSVQHLYCMQIWRNAFTEKQKSPYMSHLFPSCTVHGMQFCPFEDVLGVGHSQGFGSLLIPGKIVTISI